MFSKMKPIKICAEQILTKGREDRIRERRVKLALMKKKKKNGREKNNKTNFQPRKLTR